MNHTAQRKQVSDKLLPVVTVPTLYLLFRVLHLSTQYTQLLLIVDHSSWT